MSRTRIVTFQPWHAETLVREAADPEWKTAKAHDLTALSKGTAYTILMDEHPIACGGVVDIWNGFGEAWVIVSQQGLKHTKVLLRAARQGLALMWTLRGYHCIQASSLTEGGCRFLEHLGFSLEHEIQGAGPAHQSLFLYVRRS